MTTTTYATITDVRNYVESTIGEWPEGTVAAVAEEIRDRAHDAGLIYGQDWSEIVESVLPERGWQESVEGIIEAAGISE